MTFENFCLTHIRMARFKVFINMWVLWISLWNWSKFLLVSNAELANTWFSSSSHLLGNRRLFSWTLSTWSEFGTLCFGRTKINLTIINSSSNHVIFIIFDLTQVCFKTLNLSYKSILFKFHQHLLFDCCFILSWMGVKLLLELIVFTFAFIDIAIQLLFFLLNTSVIDLLEISLLS